MCKFRISVILDVNELFNLILLSTHLLQQVYLELEHNHNFVNSIYEWTPKDKSAAANTAILRLAKGDTVTVVTVKGEATTVFGSPTEYFTTFSGALISVTVGGNQQST